MKEIIRFLKPHKNKLILVAVMHAIATFSQLLLPYLMSKTVDEGIRESREDVIITSAVMMLIFAALSLMASLVSNNIHARVTTGFSSSLCRHTFGKINSLSMEQYSKMGSSGLLTRCTDDIFNIEGAAIELVYTVVAVPMLLIGGSVLAFLADPVLALIFILAVPLVLVIIIIVVRPLGKMWDKSDEYVDVQNRIVRERLSGLRVVRAFNNDKREHKRAKFATEEMAKYIIRANVRGGYIEPVAMLILNITTVIMLYFARSRVESGALSEAGGVIAAVQYVALIANAVIMLSWTIAWIPHLKVSVKRISEVLCLETQECSERKRDILTGEGADISIKNLTFTYPGGGAPVLSDISLDIKRGERVAIIGGTGSGKSTLIALLLRFFREDAGEISINGIPYSDLTEGDIRSAYSAALQRGMVFEGTLRDNVVMGERDIPDEKVIEAARDAELFDFLSSHEEGLDFGLVGGGRNISGGQKQRVGMARAILREADVYIFDDSFSALDYLTERKIEERLAVRLRGKTVITVTQRVATALASERIILLDGGRVQAVGTHEELLLMSDIYREICISQLGRECIEGGDKSGS